MNTPHDKAEFEYYVMRTPVPLYNTLQTNQGWSCNRADGDCSPDSCSHLLQLTSMTAGILVRKLITWHHLWKNMRKSRCTSAFLQNTLVTGLSAALSLGVTGFMLLPRSHSV